VSRNERQKSGKTTAVARVFLGKNMRKKALFFAIKALRFSGGVMTAGSETGDPSKPETGNRKPERKAGLDRVVRPSKTR
jgi:hypothetical protein